MGSINFCNLPGKLWIRPFSHQIVNFRTMKIPVFVLIEEVLFGFNQVDLDVIRETKDCELHDTVPKWNCC